MEIILAVAVISIIIGGIMPLFSVIHRFRTDCEAVLLCQRLKYVRELSSGADAFATVPGRKYEGIPRIYIDQDNHRYWYRRGNKIIKKWDYGTDINISCNRPEIFFYRNGEATAGTYTIHSGNKIRRVIIDRVGRIRIE
ncbi:MAG: hypothetical protein J6M33_00820 [Anaerovibrio sp.]|nr:hypothetical protein [Anaerovibrio sp.]